MRHAHYDADNRFAFAFDDETGAYIRTGVLDGRGRDTGEEPFMASFPHLIDVGVMGSCRHGKSGLCAKAGIGCYQSGPTVSAPNMELGDFRWIAEQCAGKVCQFALGGRGDPDQHERFGDILAVCRENGIVPNFTTSGLGMTADLARLCGRHCGAVAVSWYRSPYTRSAIDLLLGAGVRTNVHYVLGGSTIDEATDRLASNGFPEGVNAVIFLLHKPVGLGSPGDVLDVSDPRLPAFFAEFEKPHPFKVGMDSCTVPGALRFCRKVAPQSLDTCEAARFSCYIGPDLSMVPCSFDQGKRYAVRLRPLTIEQAWNGGAFEAFRDKMRGSCPGCGKRSLCLGGCPIVPQIVLCDSKERGGAMECPPNAARGVRAD